MENNTTKTQGRLPKSLNKLYEKHDQRDGIIYWCNATGDIHFPKSDPKMSYTPAVLPDGAKELYNKYWSETHGCWEYVVTVQGKYGMAIGWLFDYGYFEDLLPGTERDDFDASLQAPILAAIQETAQRILGGIPAEADIFMGSNTDPDGHELLAFFPAEICERYDELRTKLTDNDAVYNWFEEALLHTLNVHGMEQIVKDLFAKKTE